MSRSLTRSRAQSSRRVWLPEGLRDSFNRWLEIIGGGGIMLLAVLLAVALLTYYPQDASWNTATAEMTTGNWLGSTGALAADILWQFFGYGGFLLAVVLAAWGWRILSSRSLDMLAARALLALAAMLTAATALAMLAVSFAPTALPGGAFGKLLGSGLHHVLPALWGKAIIFVLALGAALVSLYMACALTPAEWGSVAQTLHRAGLWLVDRAYRAADGVTRLWNSDRSGVADAKEPAPVEEDEEPATAEQPVAADDDDENVEQPRVPVKASSKPAKPAAAKKEPLIKRPAASARQSRLALRAESDQALPPLDLLQWPDSAKQGTHQISEEALEKNAKLLESVLADFGVNGAITKVSPGPVVTLYELEPAPGTRASRVISLADDIARNMSAASVRVAVVPGRNVIGIELPNARRETVYLRELLASETYNDTKAALPLVLGKDIAGQPIIADMARMPHLLIAGTTGSGKSVGINTMILSLLYRLPPQKCRFIMIDPKMLELSIYDGIPHLLAPVVTEPKKAIMSLRWTVREMEERYRAMSKLGVRNIDGYNMRLREAAKNGESLMRTVQTGFERETGKPIYEEQPLDLTELPYIVVIVDEMADLMLVAGKEIEGAVQRLAQMARAAGIHILMATQRPSVDVITGTIKANFPTRISFQVTSKIDSRTILGEQGAEQLLGQGDMLYMAGGGRVTRVHGPFVRDDEVESIVKFLKAQGAPDYLDEVTEDTGDAAGGFGGDSGGDEGGGRGEASGDSLYDKAVDVVLRERKVSTSFVQRQLQIGYNKAANLVERMERDGVISGANGMGKREIFGRKPDED